MLQEHANVEEAYNMTPADLNAKIATSDALIVRSATKVRCTLTYTSNSASTPQHATGRAGTSGMQVQLTGGDRA